MSKPGYIELPTGDPIAILHEDRSALAIDKPRGWMLVPFSWQKTSRNLQAALTSSIAAKDYWARSRSIRFLRFVHRLDADTTGILLFAKSPGAVNTLGDLFEGRKMEKVYLAVVEGIPKQREWIVRCKLAADPNQRGKMRVDPRGGKASETSFQVLEVQGKQTLIQARPFTGRTHQIRVHLLQSGYPIVGDELYGNSGRPSGLPLALRAVGLSYVDPFTRRQVHISAPMEGFLGEYGFSPGAVGKGQGL